MILPNLVIICDNHPMFIPAKQSKLSEKIVAQVEKAIINKRILPGEKLPTERTLQQNFKTSRDTIREALGILRYKGLVEIKRGGKGGAFVREPGVDQVSESLALLIKYQQVSFKELAEFRISVEGTAAGLTAERASPQDIQELNKALARGEEILGNGYDTDLELFYRWERDMHQSLSKMSKNAIIQWVMRTIHINLDAYVSLVYWDKTAPVETMHEWQEICESIEKHEVFQASALIRSHLIRYNRILKQGAKDKGLLTSEDDDLFLI